MKHLAIIADGNRRWAKSNNLPEWCGYKQGLDVIEQCCQWCVANRVEFLTVYCLSTENWSRGESAMSVLFGLADKYMTERLDWYINNNIRIIFSGRRDRLKSGFAKKMAVIEEKTGVCDALTLVVCVDYGGRDEIVRAIASGATPESAITTQLDKIAPAPEVILRTGGQHRLSNFLLWQSAYAELFFLDELFPELTNKHLDEIKLQFEKIQRNFGR